MNRYGRIIESYEEFIAEGGLTGGATYGVVTDPSDRGSIGHEYMSLLQQVGRNAVNIMNHKVWDAVVKSVESCRDEIVTKLKEDGHRVWQDTNRLAKEFIDAYGEDYAASFLISRMQSR